MKMALKKCTECGGSVSTKAKICPNCGAKAPKKTSLFTWFALLVVVGFVYSSFDGYTDYSAASAASSGKPNVNGMAVPSSGGTKVAEPKKDKVRISPPLPSWASSTSKDEMTGELQAYASSPTIGPKKQMTFPYQGVNAWLGVGCDIDSEWAYIGFSGAPNLSDTQTEDGYNLIRTRLKWDDEVEEAVFTQKWGAKFLHFRNDTDVLKKMAAANKALLELQWHGQQPVYFEFTLRGAGKAIGEIRSQCKVSV
ncbi:hypothetical protein M0G74_07965 [Microbulbifer sp. CAU 1566]|uniref:hypothetical protein n=1 Tax=Microbulbifer sp. CAU 1566 TaxID=2933269 RepID=UPI0020068539|nr:hypothetical protein [Microbulbifer sp. CAU 1566]MCK7597208.1 hypothetical protein [Microbulbifer sp. CAU 1566]